MACNQFSSVSKGWKVKLAGIYVLAHLQGSLDKDSFCVL
jgi:hypothetical protein